MDWGKKGKELYDTLVKPYTNVSRELEFIKQLNLTTPSGKKIKFTEYQEEFLFHIHEGKNVVVYKTRQSGYTTMMLLHILYVLYEEYCRNGHNCKSNVLYVTANAAMKEDVKRRLMEIIQNNTLSYSSGFAIELRKHITFTTYSRIDALCGKCFDYVFYDEFAFAEPSLFLDFFECAYAGMAACRTPENYCPPTGKSVMVTSLNEKNEEKIMRTISELGENLGSFEYMNTHWYEVPTMNQNLVWKKYEVEPTIDEEGNVRYDKERWEKRLKDGWIPTSPKYEKLCEILGDDKAKTELLN